MTNQPTKLELIHGRTRKPAQTEALKHALQRSNLSGTLLIGYPVGVDAVLVSSQGQVTAIDLPPNRTPGEYQQRQDDAFFHVNRLLCLNPAFRTGRNPKVSVQTITMAVGSIQLDLDNQEHPLANTATIGRALLKFQQTLAPEGLDHDQVLNQLLRHPSVHW